MIGRRTLLGLAPAALVSCARSEGAYFGSTVAPKTRRLVHTLGGEIEIRWHGAEALQTLIRVDQRVEREWGIGRKSESVARAALAHVRRRAR